MTFAWPFWLILIIPIVVAFWLRPLRTRTLTVLHAVTLGLLLLALCGLSIVLPSRNGCVVLVADRSLSMPSGSQEQQVEAGELLYARWGPGTSWRSCRSASGLPWSNRRNGRGSAGLSMTWGTKPRTWPKGSRRDFLIPR